MVSNPAAHGGAPVETRAPQREPPQRRSVIRPDPPTYVLTPDAAPVVLTDPRAAGGYFDT